MRVQAIEDPHNQFIVRVQTCGPSRDRRLWFIVTIRWRQIDLHCFELLPELFCAVLCTTVVLSYMHIHMSGFYRWTRACWFSLVSFCVCFWASYCVFLCVIWFSFGCQYQHNQLPGKTRPQNDLLGYVHFEWDLKPLSRAHWSWIGSNGGLSRDIYLWLFHLWGMAV